MPVWKNLIAIAVAAALAGACAEVPVQNARPDVERLQSLSQAQKTAIATWLGRHKTLRMATPADCNCDEDIARQRREGSFGTPMPGFEPYVLVADLNHDGFVDFAVVVTEAGSGKAGKGKLLIFNGTAAGKSVPAFETDVSVPNQGLFQSFDRTALLFGPFESEACAYKPKGRGYVEDCDDDES